MKQEKNEKCQIGLPLVDYRVFQKVYIILNFQCFIEFTFKFFEKNHVFYVSLALKEIRFFL